MSVPRFKLLVVRTDCCKCGVYEDPDGFLVCQRCRHPCPPFKLVEVNE